MKKSKTNAAVRRWDEHSEHRTTLATEPMQFDAGKYVPNHHRKIGAAREKYLLVVTRVFLIRVKKTVDRSWVTAKHTMLRHLWNEHKVN